MNHAPAGDPTDSRSPPVVRRSFLVRFLTVLAGGIAALFPLVAAWGVLWDPLRRQRDAAGALDTTPDGAPFVRIGPLEMLPASGIPRQFAVTTDVVDAWTRVAGQRVGSVFLSRAPAKSAGELQVLAFTATCPHLGCSVDYDAAAGQYQCPCHASAFAKDGQKLFGPSLRGLDPLPVKLVDNNGQREIWVAFERFRPGIAQRIPIG
jgi:quinol---cytochrome c reductase iron-sulfur subunit, bacillus type